VCALVKELQEKIVMLFSCHKLTSEASRDYSARRVPHPFGAMAIERNGHVKNRSGRFYIPGFLPFTHRAMHCMF
jgi:hypothetical protein